MPAIPELGQVRLEIRRGEVLGELDPDQTCHPDSNICVAAEVKVDLKCVGVHDDPHPARRADLGRQRVVQGDNRQRIGDHELFEEPNEDALPGE